MGRKELKEEQTDEMMTLEDFIAKAEAIDNVDVNVGDDEDVDVDEVKMPLSLSLIAGGIYAFDNHQQVSVSVSTTSSAFHILDKVEGLILTFGNDGSGGGSESLGIGK